MRMIGGETKARSAFAAPGLSDGAGQERASALQAFKRAIDALFEAETAERAILPVRRLFALAHRAPLRLATLDGRFLAPPFAQDPATAAARGRREAPPTPHAALERLLPSPPTSGTPPRERRGAAAALARLLTSR